MRELRGENEVLNPNPNPTPTPNPNPNPTPSPTPNEALKVEKQEMAERGLLAQESSP